jgi:hypothetical protein
MAASIAARAIDRLLSHFSTSARSIIAPVLAWSFGRCTVAFTLWAHAKDAAPMNMGPESAFDVGECNRCSHPYCGKGKVI